jgi:hypothetical protein
MGCSRQATVLLLHSSSFIVLKYYYKLRQNDIKDLSGDLSGGLYDFWGSWPGRGGGSPPQGKPHAGGGRFPAGRIHFRRKALLDAAGKGKGKAGPYS